MARDGLLALVCAGIVSVAGPLSVVSADPGEVKDTSIATTLAVQTALQQGREHLLRGNPEAAVVTLEAQLARINGNREYLTVLRDAYRACIKELRLAKKDEQAESYLQRLLILDPGATLDGSVTRAANSPAAPAAAGPKAPAGQADRQPPASRESPGDPFHENNSKENHARKLVEQARHEFGRERYEVAGRLFDEACQADPNCAQECREPWGYCKLRRVGELLNDPTTKVASYPELEREVKLAVNLAPRLDTFGKTLLGAMQDRRKSAEEAAAEAKAPPMPVRHHDRSAEGWAAAETANFLIFHNQPRDYAEKAAQAAERTRAAMHRKWFGETGGEWNPRCEIYLHATGADYSRVTGVPANSPGHSTIRSDSSRVITRRIDLHCDDPNLLGAVLPHETTHVVLAGRFGEQPVPRWADEGIAVLTEPRDKVERHLRNLPQYRQDQQLFNLRQLMHLSDYPDPRYVGPFYAQSVSVVDFLSREKGPQTFTQFLRDGLRVGYEASLRRHYGYQDFNELEQRWRRFAFNEPVTAAGLAERSH